VFLERFVVNHSKQLQIVNMFDIKQGPNETLNHFLNRFFDVSMGLVNLNGEMLVGAFVKGLHTNPFSESLIKSPTTSLLEIRGRAAIHIEIEEATQRKRAEERQLQVEHKG